ncbi:hypothetical protein E8E12_011233 [Didymella heteroderae]|uniref:BTB domain-containing protein n=1 Tax=Didymella heteroderae TaxID=1769908 RepID=A0A9P4X1Z9_9PLEO|nr:hypothetical protein E8E12_011233 [Didymella heteroderae]
MSVPKKIFPTAGTTHKMRVVPTPHSLVPVVSPSQKRSEHVGRLGCGHDLDISGTCLRVTVGKDVRQQDFWVHENLFNSRSEFFRRTTKEEWVSSTPRTVSLPEDKPKAFQLYATLTYTGFVASKGLPDEWQPLVDVYILAESLQDSWAKNRIVNAMHNFIVGYVPKTLMPIEDSRIFGQHFSAVALHNLYNGTPGESQARKLVGDLFADNVTPEWLESESLLLPPRFLVDLTVRLLHKRSHVIFDNMVSRRSSHYHEKIKDHESKQKEDPLDGAPVPTSKPEVMGCLISSVKQMPCESFPLHSFLPTPKQYEMSCGIELQDTE